MELNTEFENEIALLLRQFEDEMITEDELRIKTRKLMEVHKISHEELQTIIPRLQIDFISKQ